MKMKVVSRILWTAVILWAIDASAKPVVALDCYHNNEAAPHYTWQLTSVGGYSQFAQIILGLGADTVSIKTAVDSAILASVSVFIITDPDDSAETANPKFISDAEADVLDKWVQRGGSLMLLGNNKGNGEFPHFNVLAGKFGIHFNDDTQPGGPDYGPLPQIPLFAGCDTLHIVGICTQTLLAPAQALYTNAGNVLISSAAKGSGNVFAMGDPWFYNEYINSKDNKACATNVIKWLLGISTSVSRQPIFAAPQGAVSRTARPLSVLPNGRLFAPKNSASGMRVEHLGSGGRMIMKLR